MTKPEVIDVLGVEATRQDAVQLLEWLNAPKGALLWRILRQHASECHARSKPTTGQMYDTGGSGRRIVPYEYMQRQANDNLAMENAYENVLDMRALLGEIVGPQESA